MLVGYCVGECEYLCRTDFLFTVNSCKRSDFGDTVIYHVNFDDLLIFGYGNRVNFLIQQKSLGGL